MEDNILKFPGVDEIMSNDYEDDLGPKVTIEDILEGAKHKGLEDVILIGRDGDRRLYFASTTGNSEKILFDIERAKHILMNMVFAYDEQED